MEIHASVNRLVGGHTVRAVAHLSLLCALLLATPAAVLSQGLADDAFAAALVGEWSGSGVYQGNELALTRSWTLELGGQFLRGDMRVSMANGASFGALTYWKTTGEGAYEIVWLDATGRVQHLQAERDAEAGVIFSDFVDDLADGGSAQRRWVFEVRRPNSYSERLLTRTADGWELLTEWVFQRPSREAE